MVDYGIVSQGSKVEGEFEEILAHLGQMMYLAPSGSDLLRARRVQVKAIPVASGSTVVLLISSSPAEVEDVSTPLDSDETFQSSP